MQFLHHKCSYCNQPISNDVLFFADHFPLHSCCFFKIFGIIISTFHTSYACRGCNKEIFVNEKPITFIAKIDDGFSSRIYINYWCRDCFENRGGIWILNKLKDTKEKRRKNEM